MRIAIASDHAAFEPKTELATFLRDRGHEVVDLGADGEAWVGYPDYGYKSAAYVASGKVECGVALWGKVRRCRAVFHLQRSNDRIYRPEPLAR